MYRQVVYVVVGGRREKQAQLPHVTLTVGERRGVARRSGAGEYRAARCFVAALTRSRVEINAGPVVQEASAASVASCSYTRCYGHRCRYQRRVACVAAVLAVEVQ